MLNQFSRTELLLGKEAMEGLENKRVAIFGIGGVGGYVCEALVRSGVGHFDLIDNDTVSLTNINRQIIATHSTVGRQKVEVMKERMLDINPDADITIHQCFFLPENADEFDFNSYDYVVDAVDTVTAKIEIIMKCKELGVPVISAMGAGNKLDPSRFRVADIYKTTMCPLAKVMRKEMKKRGVKDLKVVFSDEMPVSPIETEDVEPLNPGKRATPGSIAFAPSAAGLVLASEVIKDLTNGFSRDKIGE
ncbi:tRNA threonylcarbamoyladenosine dehydratase [Pseudobutyrivibrio ruminis]|uniref:tRNA threonylcarbamoyladenosine dehydratase n=1 Tax=Pseudobutyrivibrio ruminis TaxID=46206 RepID=UPI00051C70A2|nr:tRNA threonylcarbamoyladenosine dehydratase [Pseudobutyrivibrio ruminis]